jgi:uncharacterized protein YeaO (DUF488 family)
MKKGEVHADAWIKDVAPSTHLRTWYGHQPQRWREFRARYRRELRNNKAAWSPILALAKRRNVTLLYAAHDELHNARSFCVIFSSVDRHALVVGTRPSGVL